MNVAEAINIATDIITAGTALAGLLLVFLGNAVAEFGEYDAEATDVVSTRYKRKALSAFIGLSLALASVLLAFIGKIWSLSDVVALSCALLLSAFISTAVSAFTLMREIS